MNCTHVALQVRKMDPAIAFYRDFCAMTVVKDRVDDGMRVVWMGWGEDPPHFVIVLLERSYDLNEQPGLQHIGMAVASRDEVDRIYARAVAAGVPAPWPPVDAGQIVGYFCGLKDPDGNLVEFSHGQRLG